MEFDGEDNGLTFLNFQDNQFGKPGQMDFLLLPPQESGITVTKSPENNRLEIKHPSRIQVFQYLLLNLPFYAGTLLSDCHAY
jgi:hypothetical protein